MWKDDHCSIQISMLALQYTCLFMWKEDDNALQAHMLFGIAVHTSTHVHLLLTLQIQAVVGMVQGISRNQAPDTFSAIQQKPILASPSDQQWLRAHIALFETRCNERNQAVCRLLHPVVKLVNGI